VLDAAACNLDGFLWRDTCVSSTQLNRPIWNKQSLSPPGNTCAAGRVLFKKSKNSRLEEMC
jgi:hypothetical protein